ncbi:MAG: VWA domain-containing protein, partial [Acidobacteria bacterium]|nr:VWA domain-containing protein [Acidobacteriota bacterium]
MWNVRQLALSITPLLLLATQATNQSIKNQDTETETLRVDVNLVTVGVQVLDRKKRTVPGLTANGFSLFEDGKPKKIAFFSSEPQPVSMVILLDRSYSMGESQKLEQARSGMRALLEQSHPADESALVVFDIEALRLLDFTSDRRRVQSLLARISSERAGSSLYDSLVVALEGFSKARHPRQALVLITDGADQHSRLKLDEVIRTVQGSQAQVYLIGYFDPKEDSVFRDSGETVTLISGQEIDNPRFVFRRLAEESGAERYFPRSDEELQQASKAISRDLRSQYTLAYYSLGSFQKDEYRRIQVKVRQTGLSVRARHGFRPAGHEERSPSLAPPQPEHEPVSSDTIRERLLPYEIKVERQGNGQTFREDFADPTSGWPQKAGFFYQKGEYHLVANKLPVVNEGLVAANGPWWKDFRAALTLEFKVGQRGIQSFPPAAGLVFRMNERGYYALLVSKALASGKVHYKLIKKLIKPAGTVDLMHWTREWRPDSGRILQHKLRVVCTGSQIQLYVDGLSMGIVED